MNETTVSTVAVPPFDVEAYAALSEMRALMPPFSTDTLGPMRKALEDGIPGAAERDLTWNGKVVLEERRIPGPDGAPDITLLIMRPANTTETLPGLYYVHGGGMVVGDHLHGIETILPYVADGLAVGFSVEYRLAPENPHPAPVEDCYAGLKWVAEHAAELDLDQDGLLIVGTSAGGGLAAATALLARDRNFPRLSHQILICPMLDDRGVTPSSQMLHRDGVWDRDDNLFGWTALLGDRRGTDDVPPYAAPARAEDLSRLPRTYLDCGSSETFRDEILDYAHRLSVAGVSVDLHMWGGGYHGFEGFAPGAAISHAAGAARDGFIRRALAQEAARAAPR